MLLPIQFCRNNRRLWYLLINIFHLMKEIGILWQKKKGCLVFLSLIALVLSCSIESNTSGDDLSQNPEETNDLPTFDFDCEEVIPVQRRDAISFPLDPNVFSSENSDLEGTLEGDQTIVSSITGVTYRYHVYLPPEYQLEPDRSFPVLYWLDAQFWFFPNSLQPVKVIDLDQLPVILVGIEEGPSGRRAIDYTFPGIAAYNRFFTEEFIPEVESDYRILGEERTLQGVSASGLASLVMMLSDEADPPIFKNHLSFDPYIQSALNLENLLIERLNVNAPLNKSLIITSMVGGFTPSVNPYAEGLAARNIPCLTLIESIYNGDHFGATNASIGNALRDVYKDYYED
ncbi:Predicted hydrolase of the alpha/beta superfamily [Flagellimonas flava]|uniref:Predicted hydrolase of the alpha/beta superfamily n=2 Tax=Flagellimonas flava TaxID=570519 RepID=A0A1M5N3J9_9FLAO|nr:Predicted hydrolase of the alpha/beta superfamily [Allomuricauda flava]